MGHGIGLFRIGAEIFHDDFTNLDNWVVQIQAKEGFPEPRVVSQSNSLDCLLPGRGCTVWLKRKLQSRVMITYDVFCPTPNPPMQGVHPRDINNFWMASDPNDPDAGLFDSNRYTGAFGSYDKMNSYYASTGGGSSTKANVTTRMRRYPREIDGNLAAHIALNNRDGMPEFLIIPDQVMKIQLVAYDDIIQYIVDEKLVYQISQGDTISLEDRDSEGNPVTRETSYELSRFPVYKEGFFGFRMVGTHHIYSNFRIYTLEPDI